MSNKQEPLLDERHLYLLAVCVRLRGLSLLHEMAEGMAYKLKARYHGDTPVIYRQGRWYSPLFWLQHCLFALLSVSVLPFVFLWAAIMNAWRELRGFPKKATVEWEKEYVAIHATPPINYSI